MGFSGLKFTTSKITADFNNKMVFKLKSSMKKNQKDSDESPILAFCGKAVKLGKASWYSCNPGGWIIL